jgi:ribosomal 30S subunit maturation factor RimM
VAKDDKGVQIGVLDTIYPTAAHDIYIIRSEKMGELMVPAVSRYIRSIDIDLGTITFQRLEELIEQTDAI